MNTTSHRVILTGSNGFTGQKVAKLLAANPDVTLMGLSRGPDRSAIKDKFTYQEADLLDFPHLRQIFDDFRPTEVIHTAAMTQVNECETQQDLCWKVNVELVDYLAQQCKRHHARFLHLSTDFVFDGNDGPYKETDATNPLSFYGKSKLASEQLLKQAGIPYAILRTVLLYGYAPHTSRSNFVRWVKDSLEKQTPIRVVQDQYRTPTWVEDFALGIVSCLLKNQTGIYHLSGGEMMSISDLAYRVAAEWQLDDSLISAVTSAELNELAPRPKKTGFVIEKAQHKLGYQPHSLEQGLAKTIIQINGN
ncbi:MAG: SDR family oxidoreductase [Bacteroidota bacterium]